MSRLGRTQVLATNFSHRPHQQLSGSNQQELQSQVEVCGAAAKRPKYNFTKGESVDNTMTDAAATSPGNGAQTKRPNFSLAVANPNGVNKITQSLATGKPGTAKKLIIKNFKGMSSLFQYIF
jgi:cullin-4